MVDDPVTVAEQLLAVLPGEHEDNWALREAAAPHVDRARRLWAEVTAEPVDRDVVARVAPAVALAVEQLVYSRALDEGLALASTAAQDGERLLGGDHPATARLLHAQGVALVWTTDRPAAARCFERAAAVRAGVLGPRHPDTIDSRLNLAEALARSAPRDALHLAETATADAEDVLGPQHPTTLSAFTLVAGLVEDLGQAQDIREKVVEGWSESVGADHHSTLQARLELAPHAASPHDLFEGVAADATRVLGARHPLTLQARMYAAETTPGPAAAQRRVRQVLDEYRAVFGPRHSRTLYALDRYATALRANGRQDAALKIWQDVLAVRQEDHGATHPAVLLDARAVGVTAWSSGRIGDAVAAFGLLVDVSEQAFGSDHPLTVAARCRHIDIASDAGLPPPHLPDDDELRRAAAALGASHGDGAETTLRVLAATARRRISTEPTQALVALRGLASRAEEIWSLDLGARLLVDIADAAAAAGRRREAALQYLHARNRLRLALAEGHPLGRRCSAGLRASLLRRRGRS